MSTPFKYPKLLERIKANLLDTVFLIFLAYIFSIIFDSMVVVDPIYRILACFFVFYLYEPILVVFGCTAGQYAMGLRVRKQDEPTKKINIFQSIIRYTVKILLGFPSFITISSDKKHRAIHDMVVKSMMIRVN
jgi:uncharacterized RDD family membrane protein YckC